MAVACALLRPIKLLSDLENSTKEQKTGDVDQSQKSSKPGAKHQEFHDLRSTNTEIVGSQSIGLYTPRARRRAYDDNANVYHTDSKSAETLPLHVSAADVSDVNHCATVDAGESKPNKFARFYQSYYVNLFVDKIFYLYTFSWLLFAAAFFSASTYIIPFGKEELKLSDFQASTLVSAFAGGSIFARTVYAFFFDRIPINWRILYVCVLYGVFSVAVLMLSFTKDFIGGMICCACIGALGGGTDGIYSALIAEVYSVQHYPFVFGYSNLLTHSAGTTATVLIGMAVDKLQNLYVPFYIGFGSAVASSILVFLMHRSVMQIRRKKQTPELPS